MEQNEHLILGHINNLKVVRSLSQGLYLAAKDGKDVLLPFKFITLQMQEGALVAVFLYTDSEDRLVASTQTPHAKLDEFAVMRVVDTTKFGAFLDWGLDKDLFVPKQHQKEPFRVGEKRFVRVAYDERTHRLIGSEKFSQFLEKAPFIARNKEVRIQVIRVTPMGFACLVENRYEGLLFANEVFGALSVGDEMSAYVKQTRSDGKLDLSLQPIGDRRKAGDNEVILQRLKDAKGSLPYNSKSDAALIQKEFQMSKKAFKAALVSLSTKGSIEVKESGIYLVR